MGRGISVMSESYREALNLARLQNVKQQEREWRSHEVRAIDALVGGPAVTKPQLPPASSERGMHRRSSQP